MLPSSGRTENTYDPDDTWDKYVEPTQPSKPRPLPLEERSSFAAGDPSTSEEAIVKAFAQSNAMRALSEEIAPFDHGRKMVRMQNQHTAHDQYNPNILPTPVMSAACVVDQYYVGGLGVEERYKAGKYKDRLGTEYEVWESQMPPPDKDYSTIAPNTSRRHLERCMGGDPAFADRPKRESKGEINPPEPRGDGHARKERQSVAELKGQQTFFNQNGMQPTADFDVGRDTYDGYNIKAGYAERVVPVEPCWRASTYSEATPKAEPTAPGPGVRSKVVTERKEVGGSFARTPARQPVLVRDARVGLPFVNAASLRSFQVCDGNESIGALASSFEATAHNPRQNDHKKKDVTGVVDPARPALPSTARYNPEVHAHRDAEEYTANGLSQSGPVQFTSALTSVDERPVQRDNPLVAPKASREWNIRQQIIQSVDREGDDDAEVCAINQNVQGQTQPAPREDVEHVGGEDHAVDMATARPNDGAVGDRSRPKVVVERVDIVRRSDDDVRPEDGGVRAAQSRVAVTREGREEICADRVRREAFVEQTNMGIAVNRDGSDDVEYSRPRRTEVVVKARPKAGITTRDGRAQMCQPDPVIPQIGSRSSIPAEAHLADGRQMCDDAETIAYSSAVPSKPLHADPQLSAGDDHAVTAIGERGLHGIVSSHPAPAKQTLPSTHRQHSGRRASGSSNAGKRVTSKHQLSDERRHASVPVQRGRSLGGWVAADADSLPLYDRASITFYGNHDNRTAHGPLVRSKGDTAHTNRSQIHTSKTPSAHRPIGAQMASEVDSNLPPEENYSHFGAPVREGGAAVRASDDRPDSARASYGTREPANHGSDSAIYAPMRPAPPISMGSGGTTKDTRLDSRASAATPMSFIRSASRLADDRSTPTRAILAARSTDARWTPTVQMDSSRGQDMCVRARL